MSAHSFTRSKEVRYHPVLDRVVGAAAGVVVGAAVAVPEALSELVL
jgi:hypothetical protein